MRESIPYSRIKPNGNVIEKLRELGKLGLDPDDILYINEQGQVTFQRLSRDHEPINLGEMALNGHIDDTIRNCIFGAHVIICEKGGDKYLNRALDIAKRNRYSTRPIG